MDSDLKVVLVGAASPQWGYKITRDIVVTLSNDSGCAKRRPVLVLEDPDATNLAPVRQLAERIAQRCDDRVRIEATTDQRAALRGAHFVVTTLAVGSLESMRHDLEIPYEYGIFQPVGDTTSIGGAIRAARNIPALLSIARDMEAVSAPGAWLLNLCNPMSTLTRAITRETSVPTVGLCHELYGGLGSLAGWLGFDYREWRRVTRFQVLGINHCGWMTSLQVDGRDGFAALREFLAKKQIALESRRLYDSATPELRHANLKLLLFLRHGVFPYSGDRHNAEFFREFVNRETQLGADYGVLLTTAQSRLVDWRGQARKDMNDLVSGSKELDLAVSQEAVARIIKSIATDDPFFDVSNLPYLGDELPGVPRGAVLERMCRYDGRGAHPEPVPALPAAVGAHLALHATNIEDVVGASVDGDRDRMIAALRRDPLLGNMDSAKIPELWDRLAVIHARHVHSGLLPRAGV